MAVHGGVARWWCTLAVHASSLVLRRQRQEEQKKVQSHPQLGSSLGSVWQHEDLSQKNKAKQDEEGFLKLASVGRGWVVSPCPFACWKATEPNPCSVQGAEASEQGRPEV